MQLVAVRRLESYFLDAAGGGEGLHVLLVEGLRPEDERFFERLDEGRDAAGCDNRTGDRDGDQNASRAHATLIAGAVPSCTL